MGGPTTMTIVYFGSRSRQTQCLLARSRGLLNLRTDRLLWSRSCMCESTLRLKIAPAFFCRLSPTHDRFLCRICWYKGPASDRAFLSAVAWPLTSRHWTRTCGMEFRFVLIYQNHTASVNCILVLGRRAPVSLVSNRNIRRR